MRNFSLDPILTQNDSNTNEWIFKKLTNKKLMSFNNFCFGTKFFFSFLTYFEPQGAVFKIETTCKTSPHSRKITV